MLGVAKGARACGAAAVIGVLGAAPKIARAEPPPEQPAARVFVHVESPEPVELRRATGERREPFRVVCTSPCDAALPFLSSTPSDDDTVPNEAPRDVGLAMIGGGLAVAATGAALAILNGRSHVGQTPLLSPAAQPPLVSSPREAAPSRAPAYPPAATSPLLQIAF